ncbi:hypothetical protein CBR_g39985 [Chara braunii]|uniref:Reverse transcriptase domain-containing protein n=1 Tax=Chara braunii TaxID=69332 RepID=A0A388LT06_CHABU|nr:hypothetical protein CBR_g39985 [Chara braunii]|eukprot:GBG85342.1 hypothetical protein CBR_g39985 [Chara braunii]
MFEPYPAKLLMVTSTLLTPLRGSLHSSYKPLVCSLSKPPGVLTHETMVPRGRKLTAPPASGAQALVGLSDEVKLQRVLRYVLHSHHQEVGKVMDAANGSWARFRDMMRRKYRLGDGLLTIGDLEAMNKEDFSTIGAFVHEFKKKARKVHGMSEETQCAIFLGLLTGSEASELTGHGGGSEKLTWATIDKGVEEGSLDQVEQHQVRLQRRKRKERDATASGTPGVKKIVTDVLAALGYDDEVEVQKRGVIVAQGRASGAVDEEAGREDYGGEETGSQILTKAQRKQRNLQIGGQGSGKGQAPQAIAAPPPTAATTPASAGPSHMGPPSRCGHWVDLVIKNQKCTGMVNTGAEMNIIREKEAVMMGMEIDRADHGMLHGANCKAAFCGTASNGIIEIGKVRARICFFVMPDVDHSILLGRSFFCRTEMLIFNKHDGTMILLLCDPTCGNYEVITCRNTGPGSERNRPNLGSFTFEESENERRWPWEMPEEEDRAEVLTLSLTDVNKAMEVVSTRDMADPEAIKALRELILENPQVGEVELVYRLPGGRGGPAMAQARTRNAAPLDAEGKEALGKADSGQGMRLGGLPGSVETGLPTTGAERPEPRVERRQRSKRPRDPEARGATTTRGGRKALAQREGLAEAAQTVEPVQAAGPARAAELPPAHGLKRVEFRRITGSDLRGLSPALPEEGEVVPLRTPLDRLEAHLDASQWGASQLGADQGGPTWYEPVEEEPEEKRPEAGPRGPEEPQTEGIITVGDDTTPPTPIPEQVPQYWPEGIPEPGSEEIPVPPLGAITPPPTRAGLQEGERARTPTTVAPQLTEPTGERMDEKVPISGKPPPGPPPAEEGTSERGPSREAHEARVRRPSGETREEKRARVQVRLEELYQEKLRMEAAGEAPKPPIDPPTSEQRISEAWASYEGKRDADRSSAREARQEDVRVDEARETVDLGFSAARMAIEHVDKRIGEVAISSFQRYSLLSDELAASRLKVGQLSTQLAEERTENQAWRSRMKAKEVEWKKRLQDMAAMVERISATKVVDWTERIQYGIQGKEVQGLFVREGTIETPQREGMGKVFLDSTEAAAKQEAEEGRFSFRTPTELASQQATPMTIETPRDEPA